jgi:hypothetical protein
MQFELRSLKTIPICALLILSLVSFLSSSLSATSQRESGCTEGVEIAVNTSVSTVCLSPYELESACTPPGGSLAGNPVCSAISSSSAIKENFPLVKDYPGNASLDENAQPALGEQEVIEEGQGIPRGEQEVIEEEEGQGQGEQEVIEEGQGTQ